MDGKKPFFGLGEVRDEMKEKIKMSSEMMNFGLKQPLEVEEQYLMNILSKKFLNENVSDKFWLHFLQMKFDIQVFSFFMPKQSGGQKKLR